MCEFSKGRGDFLTSSLLPSMDPSDPSKVRHRHVTGVDESDLFYHHQTQPKQPELEGAADKKLGVLKERVERASLTWYLSPLMTGKFFLLESYIILGNVTSRCWTWFGLRFAYTPPYTELAKAVSVQWLLLLWLHSLPSCIVYIAVHSTHTHSQHTHHMLVNLHLQLAASFFVLT